MLAQPLQRIACVAAHADDAAAARLNFLDVGHDLVKYLCVFLRYDDNGHAVVDQRDVAVLHLCSWQPFGMNVADFLQLERAFQRHRIVDGAPQEQEVLRQPLLKRDLFANAAAARNAVLNCSRDAQQSAAEFVAFSGGGDAVADADADGHHAQHSNLGGEGLGRGDTYFRSSVQIHTGVSLTGDSAAHCIAHADNKHALQRHE